MTMSPVLTLYNTTTITPDILQTMATVLAASYNAPPWNDEWSTESATLKLRHAVSSPDYIGGVVRDSTGVIVAGFSGNIEPYFSGDYFFLKDMFVHPDVQHRGIGRMMMSTLLEQLQERAVPTIMLFTGQTTPAKELYTKYGLDVLPDMRMMVGSVPSTSG